MNYKSDLETTKIKNIDTKTKRSYIRASPILSFHSISHFQTFLHRNQGCPSNIMLQRKLSTMCFLFVFHNLKLKNNLKRKKKKKKSYSTTESTGTGSEIGSDFWRWKEGSSKLLLCSHSWICVESREATDLSIPWIEAMSGSHYSSENIQTGIISIWHFFTSPSIIFLKRLHSGMNVHFDNGQLWIKWRQENCLFAVKFCRFSLF